MVSSRSQTENTCLSVGEVKVVPVLQFTPPLAYITSPGRVNNEGEEEEERQRKAGESE